MYKELREVLPDIKLTIGSGNSESDADLISDEYIFELKRYKKVTDAMIDEWWLKVCEEAFNLKPERTPVLIYKEDYRESKVVTWVIFKGEEIRGTMSLDLFKDG